MAKKGKPIADTGNSAAGISPDEIDRLATIQGGDLADSLSGSENSILEDSEDAQDEFTPLKQENLSTQRVPGTSLTDTQAGYDQSAYDEQVDSAGDDTDDPRVPEIFAKPMKSWSQDELDYMMDARDMTKSELEAESRGEIDGDDPNWRVQRNKKREESASGGRGPASILDALIPSAGAADNPPKPKTLGQKQLEYLRSQGVPEVEIAQWRKPREAVFRKNKVPEEEIRAYFGDPEFDEAPIKEYVKSNPDWHAPMAVAPAYSGKTPSKEPVKVPKEAKGFQEAFAAGFKATGVGMLASGGLPDSQLGENATIMEKLAEGAGQIAGDAAPMIGGAVLGTLGAGPVAGWFAGGAAPAGLRKILVDKYTNGEAKSSQEVWDRVQGTMAAMGEGGLINMLTMGAGAGAGSAAAKAAGKVALGEVSKAAIKTGAALTAETLTMGAAPKALNGELPEPEDFYHAATVVVGMHAIGAGVSKATESTLAKRADAVEARVSAKVDAKIKTAYAETGLTPADITSMAQKDPVLRQELVSETPGLPESLKPYKDVNGRSDFPAEPAKIEITERVPEELGGGEVTVELPAERPAAMGAEPPVAPEGMIKPELPPESTASKEKSPREAFKNATPEKQAEISAEAAFNFVKSGIGEPPGEGGITRAKRFLTEGGLREHLINKYDPLTQFVREITGAKSQQGAVDAAKPSESPVLLANVFNGVVGKAMRAIESDTFSYKDGKTTGEGLLPILKVVEEPLSKRVANKIPILNKEKGYRKTVEDFDAYVFAKHGEEVATKYDHKTGLENNAAATKKVIEIGDQIYGEAAKKFVQFQNRGLEYLKDSGMMSNDAFQKSVTKYEHFIPLEKIIVGDEPGSISKSLKPKQILKKRGKGSEEQIYSPVMRAAERVHEYVTMAEKNRTTKSLYDLMVKNEYPVKEVKADPGFKMEIMDENGKGTGEFATVYRELKSNELAFFEDGARKVFNVPEGVAKSVMSMMTEQPGVAVKLMSIPAKLLRVGVTLPLDFMLKNMFRDQFHAFTMSRGNYIPYVDYVRGLTHQVLKTETYREYQSSGAMNSSGISIDIDHAGKNLARIADKTGMRDAAYNVVKTPLHAAKIALEFMQKMSEYGEVPTRIGEFDKVRKKLLKEGYSPQDASLKAGFAARNVTIDFQRMGASMQSLNMIIPFLNPNVQGMAQVGTVAQEALSGDRFAPIIKTAALATAAGILWARNKDDPRMKEIPQWQKDMFFIIPMDEWVPSLKAEEGNINTRQNEDGTWETNVGKIIRLPRPQGMIAASGASVEAYLDYMHDSSSPTAAKELKERILNAFMPNVPISPTVFSVPSQISHNYDSFRDDQIVPWYLEDGKLPHRQFKKGTSSAAKFLSQKLFEMGVDTDYIPAPAKTDFAMNGLFGNTGRTALDVAGYALDKMAGRAPELTNKEWDDLPYVRSFTIRMPEQSEGLSAFYKLKEDHDRWVKDTAALVKSGDEDGLRMNQNRKEYLIMGEMKSDFAKANGLMKAIKEQIAQVEMLPETEVSKQEKMRTIDAYMWQRIGVARHIVEKNARVEKEVSDYWSQRSK